ncbi:hypothetical protein [Streptomyces panaciradicis]|uniref:hypothetical protein n=1 Tax=Streptomyces panaciradicis TaxID=1470261 RepID=UPI00201CF094|nr:hypothetical protein [Streptomyces panaciradicis]MCL6670900.1 hypothetical protein [Streptomyces panaciradicis]
MSLGRLKETLARAGYRSEWERYDVVHKAPIIDPDSGEYNFGNSPHTMKTTHPYTERPNLGRNGLPIIQISNKGLRSMEEAVVTFFHETYHHYRMANYGDTGSEKEADTTTVVPSPLREAHP